MKKEIAEAHLRIARRAFAGATELPVAQRVQLFEDLALILPPKEAQVCRDTAVYLREAEQLQLHLSVILQ